MKTKLLKKSLLAGMLLLMANFNYGQAPPLGTAADFVLYTSVGAMENVGSYQYLTLLTGNVGTNSGSNTNFGNVNGVMHAVDGVTAQAHDDLIIARDFLVAAAHDSAIVNPVIGNDSTFMPGTYLFPAEAVFLDLSMTLDAQGDPDAVFIFKMAAVTPVYAFSTGANAEVKLINGAQAANVFWYISGPVSIGTGTSMKGTIIAGGAINMEPTVNLEGRALTTGGQVTVKNGDLGFSAYLPVDIADALPTGPAAPIFVGSKYYGVFSTIGSVSDDGTSHVTGDVGCNSSLPTGFDPLFVSGKIEGMNPATEDAAADLLLVYNSLNTLSADIELLAPAQFGHNLVLTPNTYLMNSSVTFTDTLILDATGNEDAVFIIKTYGAFATSVNSRVIFRNGTQAKNVFWMIDGAVSIGDSSIFKGTIVANNGAIDLLKGVSFTGRALTTNGSISTTGMYTVLPIPFLHVDPENQTACVGDSVSFTAYSNGTGTFTYQWRKGEVDLVDGGNISGATDSILIINPLGVDDTDASYNVIMDSTTEPADTSENVSLTVNTAPTITTQPANQDECEGSLVSFSVETTGTDLTYQWRKGSVDLTNTGNVSGATTAVLTIDAIIASDAGTDYNMVISSACVDNLVSNNVELAVNSAPVITSEPAEQSANADESVSFTVVATGSMLTYQWKKGTVDLTDGENISGATSATLTINPVSIDDEATNYNVLVSGTCSPAVNSEDAALSVGSSVGIDEYLLKNTKIQVYPNPFEGSINIIMNDELMSNLKGSYVLNIYNVLGTLVVHTILTEKVTTVETSDLKSAYYFYMITDNGSLIQSGKMISK